MIGRLAVSFGDLAIVTLIISIILFFFNFRKLATPVRTIGFFLVLNLITEIVSRALFQFKMPNLYLLHIYTFFELLAWSLFYWSLFKGNKKRRNLYWGFTFIISVLIVLNSVFLEPITGFNSNAKTLVQIIIIGYAIYFFFLNFGKTDFSKLENQSILWINFATMLYYSGSLFIVMFMKMLISNDASTTSYNGFWLFNALLNAIFQLLILISIWKVAFSKTKSSS